MTCSQRDLCRRWNTGETWKRLVSNAMTSLTLILRIMLQQLLLRRVQWENNSLLSNCIDLLIETSCLSIHLYPLSSFSRAPFRKEEHNLMRFFVHGILILGGIFSAHMEYPSLESPPTHSPEVDDSKRPATKPRIEKMGEVASFSMMDKMTMEVINMSNNEHYMLVVDAEATVTTIEPELRVSFAFIK